MNNKISDSKYLIVEKCNKTSAWLDQNPIKDIGEYKDKQKQWELFLIPIKLEKNIALMISIIQVVLCLKVILQDKIMVCSHVLKNY